MLNLRYAELVFVFLLGVGLFAVFEAVMSYQASNCAVQQTNADQAAPTTQDKSPPDHSNNRGEQSGHKAISEPFVCGAVGFPTALRVFMNNNEGFFVGGFTLMLVLSTVALWVADFTFPDYGALNTEPIFIAPKSHILSAPLDVDVSALSGVQQGHFRLFFWGWITYNDIFSTDGHITRFCWELTAMSQDPYIPTGVTNFAFRHHTRNNCADEDCA